MSSFLVRSGRDVSELLRSLTKNERCEWNAQVAHQKWANERIARYFERIAHSLIILSFCFLAKNERFAEKTDERTPNPGPRVIPSLNALEYNC